ncbi:MAG TPA: hypothetical protein VND15_03415 [Candidatus Acidoferrales bacterium]|nr:hypothetical protein [Candidatus Acidoferrales bacterium]
MEEKRKKKVLFLGAVFIGLMFIFSYLGVANNTPAAATSSTTTVPKGNSFFATGAGNATIFGYSNTATLSFVTNSITTANTVASVLSTMRNNGTIQNYISEGSGYDLILGNVGAYQLQQLLYTELNSTNSIRLASIANARIPNRVEMFVGSQELPVLINGTYPLNFTPLIAVNSSIPVTVQALLTQNGLLYNNQVSIAYKR